MGKRSVVLIPRTQAILEMMGEQIKMTRLRRIFAVNDFILAKSLILKYNLTQLNWGNTQ